MKLKLPFILFLLLGFGRISAQVVIYTEGFETDGEGTRYTTNTYLDCANSDFFLRTNTNPVTPPACSQMFGNALTSLQGSFFWASEDIRTSTPVPGSRPPGDILTQGINVAGYTSLTVSLYLATSNNNNARWESADSINIKASLDLGPFRTVGRFMGKGTPSVGNRLGIDSNLDGAITGADPTTNCDTIAFIKYTFTIPNTGNSVRIEIDFDQMGGTEELAIDHIQVSGTLVPCTPPSITCPGTQTLPLNATCSAALPNYTALATVTGTCSPVTTQSPVAGTTVSGVGATTITLTATNTALQTGTCTFTVNKVDNTAPTITCPSNIVLPTAPGICGATASYTTPAGTDNCAGASTTQTAGLSSGFTFPLGFTTNTFRVTDASGNSTTCSFTVEVFDGAGPTITCPPNMTVSTSPTTCDTVVNYPVATAVDNCSSTQVILFAGIPSGGTFVIGASMVMFQAIDSIGNANACSFVVTVEDNTPPVATCLNVTTYLDGTGQASIAVQQVNSSSTDICSPVLVSLSSGTFTCADTGGVNVVLTVSDTSGNSSTCNSQVMVLDTIAPSAVCANDTLYLDQSGFALLNILAINGGSTDNCAINSTMASPNSFTTANIGLNNVTLTVLDNSGNASTCIAEVTILDTMTAMIDRIVPGIEMEAAPNPFDDVLALRVTCDGCEVGGILTAELWNLTGQRLMRQTLSADMGVNILQLPTRGLAAGTYLVSLTDGKGFISRRVVKQ